MHARSIPATSAFLPTRLALRLSVMQWMGTVIRTAQTRRLLAEMDDRMLSDIGVTHSQAQAEASRPAWDTACRSW